jgi:hypothetical protein
MDSFSTLTIVANGLAKLCDSQKRFAEEFGLSLTQVFPQLHEEFFTKHNLESLITCWLRSDSTNFLALKFLFSALQDHQVGLIAGLDGIALHTLQYRWDEIGWLQKMYPRSSEVKELQQNQQLRYQKLIVPGFINTYLHSRDLFRED